MTITATSPRPDAVQPRPPLPCELLDPEAYFPEQGPGWSQLKTAAIRACLCCPVRMACLRLIMRLEAGEPTVFRHGIWAGYTPRQRTRMDPTARKYLKEFGGAGTEPATAQSAVDPEPEPEPVDTPCEVCGVTVTAAYITRTGRARHGHHPEETA